MSGRAEFVDTHAHLQEFLPRSELEEILKRAGEAGVRQVVAIATTAEDSLEAIAIAAAFPGVFATVGVQPNNVAEAVEGDWECIEQLAQAPRVVAIGETGLDRFWNHTPFDQQRDWFARHLDLARKLDLPVVIHCRDCERDIIEQLEALDRPVRGVLHSFTGSWEDAQAFLELGLHISFAGQVTFTNKKLDSLRETAARLPIDRILVETDSPYLSPHPHRGKSNEPARVAVTAARIAEARGMSSADFGQATTTNARHLFGLPSDDLI